jgi:hypothetical protein
MRPLSQAVCAPPVSDATMLALSDEALARVVIAASAVPVDEREAWLMRLADRFESPRRRSRDWTRAWRARERAGIVLLKLPMDEAALVVGLIDRGLLDPLRADDHTALTEAAKKALIQFCEASLPDRRVYDTIRVELALRALRRKLPHGSSKLRRPNQRA